jgi:hypothetical protein
MSEPQSNGSEQDGGEVVSRELVIARGDAAEVFDLVEEALDQVTLTIEFVPDRALPTAVALGGDVRCGAVLAEQLEDGFGVVATIGDGIAGRPETVDERRHGRFVGGMSWAQDMPERQAPDIDDRVDLARQSSTRTTDGVIRTPFFPPAACWCARTMEESIR